MNQKSEIRDGMRIDWDVPIEMDDGITLRCDVYRPIDEGQYPVILTYGPYGKYLAFLSIRDNAYIVVNGRRTSRRYRKFNQ